MGMAGFKRFTELLDTEAEIQDKPDAIELKNVKGNIEFKRVPLRTVPAAMCLKTFLPQHPAPDNTRACRSFPAAAKPLFATFCPVFMI